MPSQVKHLNGIMFSARTVTDKTFFTRNVPRNQNNRVGFWDWVPYLRNAQKTSYVWWIVWHWQCIASKGITITQIITGSSMGWRACGGQDFRRWNGVAVLDYNDNHGFLQRLWGDMTFMHILESLPKTKRKKENKLMAFNTQIKARVKNLTAVQEKTTTKLYLTPYTQN